MLHYQLRVALSATVEENPDWPRMESLFGVCWNCGGKGDVSSQCPSLSTSLNGRSNIGKSPKESDKHYKCLSGRSDNSANAAIASEVDGVWFAFEPANLCNNAVSPADSVESLFNVLWDHILRYLSDTGLSEAPDSMLDLQTVSDSSASIVFSMPSLCAVSLLMGCSVSEWDWLSEVDKPCIDFVPPFSVLLLTL